MDYVGKMEVLWRESEAMRMSVGKCGTGIH